jgi:hypothetical protein
MQSGEKKQTPYLKDSKQQVGKRRKIKENRIRLELMKAIISDKLSRKRSLNKDWKSNQGRNNNRIGLYRIMGFKTKELVT